jgi:hypothetical protein
MGRPLDVPELRRIYVHAVPHVQAFMIWALGTGARPEAVDGEPVKSIKKGLWRACDRACVSPSHGSKLDAHEGRSAMGGCGTARAQRRQVCDNRAYAFYSPDYLSGAVKALDGLIRSVVVGRTAILGAAPNVRASHKTPGPSL